MNKRELIAAASEKSEIPKAEMETALNALLEVLTETLKDGEKVQILGFGSFDVQMRRARQGCDPHTHMPIEIPAAKVPVFKAGKPLRDAIQ